MLDVHGFCDERFQALRDLLHASLERGLDEGASFAVSVNGECVVDLWGGYRDVAHTKHWESDTLVPVASCSKVVVAIAILMLWDQRLLDLDEPIATYWPEFAQNGKAAITTRQVLVHSAGLPGFGRTPTPEEFRDWDRMTGIVEQAPVWYEPGTVTCYHSLTFGFILGELVHRVSGRPLARFAFEEITGPLGADFQFTLSGARDPARVSEVWRAAFTTDAMHPMGSRVLTESVGLAEVSLSPEMAGSVVPGAIGFSNARGLVRVGEIMASGGEVDGRRYLSRATVDDAVREHSDAEDQVMGPVRRGLFFGLHSDVFPAPTPTTIHWGGYGGSWLTMDPESGISCAYTPNRWLTAEAWYRRQFKQWRVLSEVLPGLTEST
jgi:CubicO group peptidase (beta-lactamase class C family)